eukprot:scaffold2103_cov185-Amphora_coffeaeformis.AAC.7
MTSWLQLLFLYDQGRCKENRLQVVLFLIPCFNPGNDDDVGVCMMWFAVCHNQPTIGTTTTQRTTTTLVGIGNPSLPYLSFPKRSSTD